MDSQDSRKKLHKCPSPSLHHFVPLLDSHLREANVLTEGQQKGLQDFIMDMRRDHQKYLLENPEITAMVAVFLKKILKEKPQGSFLSRAVDFFTKSEEELQADIQGYLASAEGESLAHVHSIDDMSDIFENPFPSEPSSCSSFSAYSYSSPSDLETQEKAGYESTQALSKAGKTAKQLSNQSVLSVKRSM